MGAASGVCYFVFLLQKLFNFMLILIKINTLKCGIEISSAKA